jgi:hypothetical protein
MSATKQAARTHLKRWLFNIALGMSLVLCVATCAIWVRSVFIWDQCTDVDGAGIVQSSVSLRGRFIFYRHWQIKPQKAWGYRNSGRFPERPMIEDKPGTLGFVWEDVLYVGGFRQSSSRRLLIAVPYWAIALSTAVLPTVCARRLWRRRIHRGAGLCPVCGYDLRASPKRCPECGRVIAPVRDSRPFPLPKSDHT